MLRFPNLQVLALLWDALKEWVKVCLVLGAVEGRWALSVVTVILKEWLCWGKHVQQHYGPDQATLPGEEAWAVVQSAIPGQATRSVSSSMVDWDWTRPAREAWSAAGLAMISGLQKWSDHGGLSLIPANTGRNDLLSLGPGINFWRNDHQRLFSPYTWNSNQ